MKIFFSLLFLFIYSSAQGQEKVPNAVTLNNAIEYGLKNNRAILNANRDVQKAYKDKWNTISLGLPQIISSVDYQNFIELPVSLVPAEFFGGEKGEFAELRFGTEQNIIAGVRLNQLLFDGSYLVGLEASKIFLSISQNVLEKTQIEVRKSIVNTYASVLLAQENVSILEKNKSQLDANLIELRALFENGFQEEESIEQLRLTLAEINTQLRYAQNLQTITLNMLKLLLGIPIEKYLSLLDNLESLIDDGLFESSTNQSGSVANNIDVKIAENNLVSESLLYRYEQSKALPKLSAFINGNYSGFGNQFNFLKSDQKWFGSSLIGISLNLPVFSSFGKSALRQKAKIAIEQAQTDLEETQNRVQLEIASAKNDYQLAVETYFTSKENLTLAVNIEKKNQTKYFEGIASSFELREAQLQLYGAQRNYLQSIQNVIAKKAALIAILNLPQK
tara:strand:- start:13732 stop:15075 length:1344 start_codon:yes stop_codon:yes gene_type:complete